MILQRIGATKFRHLSTTIHQKMIAVHGAYYNHNFGDLLLVKIFEKWIQNATNQPIVFPMVELHERKRFKREFPGALYGMDQLDRWNALIYAGGGDFGEPNSNVGKLLSSSWNRRFAEMHVPPGEACITRGIPNAMIALEAGPLSGWGVRRKARRILEHSAFSAVRNPESQSYLTDELRVKGTVGLIPDSALTLCPNDVPDEYWKEIKAMLCKHAGRFPLGIHQPSLFVGDNPRRKRMKEALIASLKKHPGILPVLFEDNGEGVSCGAPELADEIRSCTQRECLLIPFRGVWQTVALIGSLKAILTTKLHVGIVACALGVYAASFATHPKTLRFYRLIDRASQCSSFKSLEKSEVTAKIDRAIEYATSNYDISDGTWESVKKQSEKGREFVSGFVR